MNVYDPIDESTSYQRCQLNGEKAKLSEPGLMGANGIGYVIYAVCGGKNIRELKKKTGNIELYSQWRY